MTKRTWTVPELCEHIEMLSKQHEWTKLESYTNHADIAMDYENVNRDLDIGSLFHDCTLAKWLTYNNPDNDYREYHTHYLVNDGIIIQCDLHHGAYSDQDYDARLDVSIRKQLAGDPLDEIQKRYLQILSRACYNLTDAQVLPDATRHLVDNLAKANQRAELEGLLQHIAALLIKV